MRQYGADAAKCGIDVEVQYAIPDVRSALGDRPANVSACVSMENIQPTGQLDNACQHVVDLPGIEQVDLQRKRVIAQFRDDFLQLLAFAVDQDHFCSCGKQGFRALKADTGGCAGNGCNLAVEGSIHGGDRVIHFIILYA